MGPARPWGRGLRTTGSVQLSVSPSVTLASVAVSERAREKGALGLGRFRAGLPEEGDWAGDGDLGVSPLHLEGLLAIRTHSPLSFPCEGGATLVPADESQATTCHWEIFHTGARGSFLLHGTSSFVFIWPCPSEFIVLFWNHPGVCEHRSQDLSPESLIPEVWVGPKHFHQVAR